MAKLKKKPTAPNLAFIERIEISIKENARKRMIKRAPKPASASISSTDILNQQYLLQRTLAQRAQPQQQSQSVNIYLGDIAKLQQQETLKRIDQDANAAILRQQRGGINQERLDFVLSSLLEQKKEVKKQEPPQSFEYGFVKEGAVDYKEEQRAKSVAALERLNKGSGPRSVAFESINLLQPRPTSTTESRKRAITPQQKRSLSVEASRTAEILSKMTAEELSEKYPDITREILREGIETTKKKYNKYRSQINADVVSGKLDKVEGTRMLKEFSQMIGYQITPRLKSPVKRIEPTEKPEEITAAATVKKSSKTNEQLSQALKQNLKPSIIAEQVPTAIGGQSEEIQIAKISAKSSGRQRAAKLIDPSQPSILQSFGKAASGAETLDMRELGGASSPIEPMPTPPSSRPSSRPPTGESFTRPGVEIIGGTLPKINP